MARRKDVKSVIGNVVKREKKKNGKGIRHWGYEAWEKGETRVITSLKRHGRLAMDMDAMPAVVVIEVAVSRWKRWLWSWQYAVALEEAVEASLRGR